MRALFRYSLAIAVGLLMTVLLVAVAVAQSTPTVPQPTSQVGVLALAVLTPIAMWLGTKGYDGLKTIIPAYDKLSPTIHMVMAPLLQFGFGWVAMKLSLPVLTDVHGITAEFLGAAFIALGSAGIKRFEKSKEPSDATVALMRSRDSQPV